MRLSRKLFILCASFFALLSLANRAIADPEPVSATKGQLQKPSIYFTENRGQWDERVLYKADGGAGLTWWFERDGLTLAVVVPDTTKIHPERSEGYLPDPAATGIHPERSEGYRPTPSKTDMLHNVQHESALSAQSADRSKGHALKLRFVPSPTQRQDDLVIASGTASKQSQPATEVIPDGKLSWNNNYFLGNDSSKWAPDCGNFTRLTYRNVWEGIDVVYYGEGNQLKYDYVIKPGADPSNVRLRWLGLEEPLELKRGVFARNEVTKQSSDDPAALPQAVPALRTGTDGLQGEDTLMQREQDTPKQSELLLATSVGTLREGIPLAYQRGEDGARQPVEVSMRVLSENEVGLEVVGAWDRSKELVVDPLVWSTYLGGSAEDEESAKDVTRDDSGCLVACGFTLADNFPVTVGSFQPEHGSPFDAVVFRISSEGDRLLYCSYLGGSSSEIASKIVPDAEGGVVVGGYTRSVDFPITEEVIQRHNNQEEQGRNTDCFLTRINRDGNSLVFSTYLGGLADEEVGGLAISENGATLVVGMTRSSDFPTTDGAYQDENSGSEDGFLSLIGDDGGSLIFSSYLGGHGRDRIEAVAIDDQGRVGVAGITLSANFPVTEEAFQRESAGESDGFLACFSEDGRELLGSTYFGGSRIEEVFDICYDNDSGFVVVGYTESQDFAVTERAFQADYSGGTDGYAICLNSSGEHVIFSTYIGGNSWDYAMAVIPVIDGSFVCAGTTGSRNFPIAGDAFQSVYRGSDHDGFITELSSDGTSLLYGSYFGGSSSEFIHGIESDFSTGIFLVGSTNSHNFPITEGAIQPHFRGGSDDCFAARLDISLPVLAFINLSDTLDTSENEVFSFSIRGVSLDRTADLAIAFTSDNLPDSARFTDNGDGTGSFLWQTTFDDAGEYLATFTLSDGENEITADVVIIVNNVNRAPYIEPFELSPVDEGETLAFQIRAVDPDGDNFRLYGMSDDLPDGWQIIQQDASWWFSWQTNFENAGAYRLAITVSDDFDSTTANYLLRVNNVNSVSDLIPHPSSFILSDAFPNPFNSATTIRFGIPEPGEVSLSVWDLSGHQVATLAKGRQEAGYHEVVWRADGVPAGVYLIEMQSKNRTITHQVVIMK